LTCPFHIDISTLEGENTGLLHTFRHQSCSDVVPHPRKMVISTALP